MFSEKQVAPQQQQADPQDFRTCLTVDQRCAVMLAPLVQRHGDEQWEHSSIDPAFQERRPWNEGRLPGTKCALNQQQVWANRFWLDQHRRLRDRALFDFAIDSKLRGCDVVKVRIRDLVSGGRVRDRAIPVPDARS